MSSTRAIIRAWYGDTFSAVFFWPPGVVTVMYSVGLRRRLYRPDPDRRMLSVSIFDEFVCMRIKR